MHVGSLHNLLDGGVANASGGIVDDASQRLLVVGIGHGAEVGNDILDLLALIKAETTIDAIRNAILAHLLLKGTALTVGTVENGEVAPFPTLLSTQAPYVVTHDDGLLAVAIGSLQAHPLALLLTTVHILGYLPFVLADETVGSLYYELCRAIVLFKFKEACIGI